ncbi:VOC family protein [Magnetococcus sp. PR-3]|uniref:VOC family protein n=1 Tax=Magnetococcus sp. PR-3 TaxID=3120355 RepID=UPI002FCE3442
MSTSRFVSATTILPVSDARQSAHFYADNLGFTILGVWKSGKDSYYASVKRDRVVLEFGEGRPEHVGSGVCHIEVENPDLLYQQCLSKPLVLVGDLADRDYGERDFRVRDNSGNLLIFGTPLADKDQLLAQQNLL